MKQLLVAARQLPAGPPSEQAHFFLASSLYIGGTRTKTLCGKTVSQFPYRAGPVNPHAIIRAAPFRFSCVNCHLAVRELELATIYVPVVIDPDSMDEA